MLQGCVPWPEEFARRYIEAGTVGKILKRELREIVAERIAAETASQ
jgi:non-ribosomal peptide synthetase component E (peptide arylation enzyme)